MVRRRGLRPIVVYGKSVGDLSVLMPIVPQVVLVPVIYSPDQLWKFFPVFKD